MNQKKSKAPMIITFALVLAIYAAVFIAEQTLPATSMLFTVLKKGATYALVAVSMNLLNGFTGIFSLGQAGFMLVGAYVYGIFTIPVAQRASVYQYFDGGIVQFTVPVVIALIMAGLAAAFFAFLIGLPVLRLKSDYLAIATLGFAEIIRGSELMPYVDGIWGCEILDAPDKDGNDVISEIVYTIDNTTKTRALFEINKGIGKVERIDVNSKIPKELRRVQFENMIYIADGPSDIPAFSLVNQNGGNTFAIYPKGDMKAMRQVEQMRADGRVDMYAEADYTENTTAWMWITYKIQDIADRIRNTEKGKILSSASGVPKHLT